MLAAWIEAAKNMGPDLQPMERFVEGLHFPTEALLSVRQAVRVLETDSHEAAKFCWRSRWYMMVWQRAA